LIIMTSGPQIRRPQVIADLRRFADYLERHPDIPVPRLGRIRVAVHPLYDTDASTETAAIAEVERIADLLNIPATVSHGHHSVRLEFGAVIYEVNVITQAAHVRSDALRSYENSIVLDREQGT
jgi:hypothetical protein